MQPIRPLLHRAAAPGLLALLAACGPAAPPPEPERPAAPRSVVLVTIDTLRADYGVVGEGWSSTTPYLDRLARDGVVFGNAYAPTSLTGPSMASLFTGVYPTTHGIDSGLRTGGGGAVRARAVPSELVTLAESMQAAGYVTIGVPSNKNLTPPLGFAQGFDHYLDQAPFMSAETVNKQVRALMTEAFGEAWREEWKRTPTFLWIHYFDPHLPYTAREPWIHEYAPDYAADPGRYPADMNAPGLQQLYLEHGLALRELIAPLYASEVRYVDDQLRVLGEELGLEDEDVLLLVTSDHGEGFLEHEMFGHGRSLFEEVVRVPLLVRWPAGLSGGRAHDAALNLLDVHATMLDWCRIDPAPGSQGASLMPSLAYGDPAPSRPLVFEQSFLTPRAPIVGMISGDWKLLRNRDTDDPPRLFNLRDDPWETTDLAAVEAERAARLDAALRNLLGQLPTSAEEAATWSEDEELARELEALGYGGD